MQTSMKEESEAQFRFTIIGKDYKISKSLSQNFWKISENKKKSFDVNFKLFHWRHSFRGSNQKKFDQAVLFRKYLSHIIRLYHILHWH